ncbi:similar to Saccharomyces cerevisiae YJL106W IME2 Serine/threonine protein kinase involved in activation of meiosis, associates with Ime1p and mediates its stability, activates Ndt80p [Maudiozyma barnettii]|uniref:Similar to Saccharomyces cerevisiae YJL106W IME2 Serine/threonine protein kinase involved in activation of meiosis, associates with Ime1p and mediates its stability, activates Ndt80p n=1 Tax=Maudiozyma barnettii TaxID=61262 RepID=A0A8H2VAZ8_9SACH|nr:protein kinase IME2 [Kazachstania barnettii]CAB4251946.1 similar to Saccharomyces cerevisiae YJL106W IME2 Serine/threonine protein kinase involved in activation of meiosis, associates with Ime1p and mediates its stability, activates Ndt80p [Kazachstania barnettii]CAD1778311.1 similar to Saccharomyces cerevisiae YJL106W IME2 Serine/threonine protein kinase involved in activation of meiosis, associates with Ime1p and mediates its stability, activates Ndt80p [Kazachstania barnettii]
MTIHRSNSESGGGGGDTNNDTDNGSITIPPDIESPPSYLPLKSLQERYLLMEKLGTGSFGSVILAKANFNILTLDNYHISSNFKHTMIINNNNSSSNNRNNNLTSVMTKTQNIVAIKTMMTKLNTLHDYTRVREIKFILSIPTNKHIIQIFEIFIDNSNFQLHIVMESMEQNLYQLMKNRRHCYFSIPTLKSILAQILEGIKHVHSYDFFHRDIKPENILVSTSTSYFDKKWLSKGFYEHNYVVKLADFGLARNVNNRSPYTEYVSTRWYRSPEILLRNGFYSKPIDIWAFGCVAVEVANFKPLFPGSNEMDQIWKILQVLGTPTNINLDLKDYNDAPGGRWDHIEILAKNLELEIPFVQGISIKPFLSSTQLNDLIDVVRNCLLWDPKNRMTADRLSSMPFFKDTLLQTGEEENINCDMNEDELTNKDQAMMFAGIKPTINNINNNVNENKNIIKELQFQPKNYVPYGPHQIYDGDNLLNSNVINNEEMYMEFERDSSPSFEDDEDENNTFDESGTSGNHSVQDRILPTMEFDPEQEQESKHHDNDDEVTNNVTRLLSSYKITKGIPTSDYFTPDDGMTNLRKISEDIDIIAKENSDFFNDYAMETPLLNSGNHSSNQNSNKEENCNDILQFGFNNTNNDERDHDNRKLKNHQTFFTNGDHRISSEYDHSQIIGNESIDFTFKQATPRLYFNTDGYVNDQITCSNDGNDNNISNNWSKFGNQQYQHQHPHINNNNNSSKPERNSNTFFGNITF